MKLPQHIRKATRIVWIAAELRPRKPVPKAERYIVADKYGNVRYITPRDSTLRVKGREGPHKFGPAEPIVLKRVRLREAEAMAELAESNPRLVTRKADVVRYDRDGKAYQIGAKKVRVRDKTKRQLQAAAIRALPEGRSITFNVGFELGVKGCRVVKRC